MLRIGYVRLQDDHASEDGRRLQALGCHVVRAEDDGVGAGGPVIATILDFIGDGDELMVTGLDHLGGDASAMLAVVERLHARGASLRVVEPQLTRAGDDGAALRAVLQALAAQQPPARRRPSMRGEDIQALRAAGVGPVEIARRLGVSRMTVWRRLKAMAS